MFRKGKFISPKATSRKVNSDALKEESTLTGDVLTKKEARDRELEAIIKDEDGCVLLVIGPCPPDNEEAILEYIHRLVKFQKEAKDYVFMVMRVYTAKSHTNGDGYKGLIHRSDTSEAPSLINGTKVARNLHYRVISEIGLATTGKMLYPENLPLVDDLVSYIAIDARSAEDQQHRSVASGISVPMGMKNPTPGSLNVMFNDIYAAQNEQSFLFSDKEAKTSDNPLAHATLHGATSEYGKDISNYYYDNVIGMIEQYEKMGLENPFAAIDTNHNNSDKQCLEQVRIVCQTLINHDWNEKTNKYIRGLMTKSYLEGGCQGASEVFGKSITDPCLGWENTA